jgi:hypothetical protein
VMSKEKYNKQEMQMKQIIELYIWKLSEGFITDAEIDKYEELIELYCTAMKKRLEQGIKNDN